MVLILKSEWTFAHFEFIKELGKSQQVLVVKESKKGSYLLRFYEKRARKWTLLLETPVVIGKGGFAPRGEKLEGDSRTPSGVFPLGIVWGYSPSIETKMPYHQVDEEDKFVDDPNSDQYNQWVRGVTKAQSYEMIKRQDGVYEFGVVINYNMNPTIKGKGSAIFLHIWRSSQDSTAGCVAMEKSGLLKILSLLNPQKNPQILLNP